jgi:hypothetical protein
MLGERTPAQPSPRVIGAVPIERVKRPVTFVLASLHFEPRSPALRGFQPPHGLLECLHRLYPSSPATKPQHSHSSSSLPRQTFPISAIFHSLPKSIPSLRLQSLECFLEFRRFSIFSAQPHAFVFGHAQFDAQILDFGLVNARRLLEFLYPNVYSLVLFPLLLNTFGMVCIRFLAAKRFEFRTIYVVLMLGYRPLSENWVQYPEQ